MISKLNYSSPFNKTIIVMFWYFERIFTFQWKNEICYQYVSLKPNLYQNLVYSGYFTNDRNTTSLLSLSPIKGTHKLNLGFFLSMLDKSCNYFCQFGSKTKLFKNERKNYFTWKDYKHTQVNSWVLLFLHFLLSP